MTLLNNDKSIKPRSPNPTEVIRWPVERYPEGIGLSVRDGWNFFLGGGAALVVVVGLAQLIIGCAIGVAIVVAGGSLGVLL